MFYIRIGFLLVLFVVGCSSDQPPPIEIPPPVEIPLDKIWAFEMPGTSNVRDLDAAKQPDSLVAPILKELSRRWLEDMESDKCFVVVGTPKEALQNAYNTIVLGHDTRIEWTPEDNLSLVFYSRPCSAYVHLKNVERKRNDFLLEYEFVPHDEKNRTQHFAMIPLGKLTPGEYHVLPQEEPVRSTAWNSIAPEKLKKLISQHANFVIQSKQVPK